MAASSLQSAVSLWARLRGGSLVLRGLFLAGLLPEILLSGAGLGLWGDPHWRMAAFGHGGFWIGLLGNWRPNFAIQPLTMFVTYGFLHGGIVHFGLNMLTLVSLGRPLVERMGAGRFLALYTAALLGGAAGFALLSSSPQPMVGASGALFGLAGAILAFAWRRHRADAIGPWPILRSVLWLVALNLLLWWAMHGQLAWETHLGGFLTGWLVAPWLLPEKD